VNKGYAVIIFPSLPITICMGMLFEALPTNRLGLVGSCTALAFAKFTSSITFCCD
jgi:hypothetical protein